MGDSVDYDRLRQLGEKFYFTVDDVADILNLKQPSARVLCNRYAKRGIFIRLKNNFYLLEQNWKNLSQEDLLRIANLLQVPSYISFTTALSYYEITTQIQRGFIESVCARRSVHFSVKGAKFTFYKLKKEYYFDFIKKGEIFIATKEKAFIDACYLYSFGRYALDFSALNLDKLDKSKIKKLIVKFPVKTQLVVKNICKI